QASPERRPLGSVRRVDQDSIHISGPWFEIQQLTMQTTDRPGGLMLEQPTPSGRLARSLALPEQIIH
ncbi:MAG: hypothetical protein ACK6D3_07750, partial [Planctomycetaceae bacterium]